MSLLFKKELLVLPFFAFIFFFGTTRYHLWKPDEPRYAEVSREMLEKKSFLIPVLNGEVYYDKPPGFFLLVGLSYKGWGRVDELSARFVSGFFSILSILLLITVGGIFFGEKETFLGSLILGTSFEYLWIARRVNMDNVLSFFVLASLLSFYGWYKNGNRSFLFLFYILMGLGMLIKGPLSFIVPLGTVLIFLGLKDFGLLKRISLLKGVLLSFLPAALWLFIGTIKVGFSYPKTIIGMHVLGMYFTKWSHPRPIYYYLLNFPLDFTPWTFLIPASLYSAFKFKLWKDENFLFFMVWFVFSFVFLSLSKAKRELYLLPAYPAASMLLSVSLLRFKKSFKTELAVLSFFIIAFSFFALYFSRTPALKSVRVPVFFLFFPMGLFFLVVSKRRVSLATFALCSSAFVMLSVFCFSMWVFPKVDAFKFPEAVIKAVKENPEIPLYFYKYRNAQFNFYLRRSRIPVLHSEKDLRMLSFEGKPFLLVVRKKHLDFSMGEFDVVSRSPTWDGEIYLLRFRGKSGIKSKKEGV